MYFSRDHFPKLRFAANVRCWWSVQVFPLGLILRWGVGGGVCMYEDMGGMIVFHNLTHKAWSGTWIEMVSHVLEQELNISHKSTHMNISPCGSEDPLLSARYRRIILSR